MDEPRFRNVGSQKNYVIMRVDKVKGTAKIGAAARHNLREYDVKNADQTRTVENQRILGGSSEEIMERHKETYDRVQSGMDRKIRSDAVTMGEFMFGISPDRQNVMSDADKHAYFAKALDWVKDRHGAENVLSAVLHKDELHWHMHVMFTPVTDRGTFSFKEFYGGRGNMSRLQTDYWEKVGKEFGLDRGEYKSAAQHMEIRDMYARSQKAEQAIDGQRNGTRERQIDMPSKDKIKSIQKEFKCTRDEALVRFGRDTMFRDAVLRTEEIAKDRDQWKATARRLQRADQDFAAAATILKTAVRDGEGVSPEAVVKYLHKEYQRNEKTLDRFESVNEKTARVERETTRSERLQQQSRDRSRDHDRGGR